MMPEIWGWLAGLLLLAATIAGFLALFALSGPWKLVGLGAKAAAALALIVVLVLAQRVSWQNQAWWTFGFQRSAWSLALAVVIVDLVLAWRIRADAGTPFVDLAALLLVIGGTLSSQPSAPAVAYAGAGAPHTLESILIAVGVGALLVAGSAGLALGLRQLSKGRAHRLGWAGWLNLHVLLKHALALSLVTLGAGLVLGVWLSWRSAGFLTSGSAHAGWAAGAALIVAMGLLARRTGERWGRWAAGLAVLAAVVAALGILAVTDLCALPGT